MKNSYGGFFRAIRGMALRARMARAFDRNDMRKVFALSRQIDAMQCAMIRAANQTEPASQDAPSDAA